MEAVIVGLAVLCVCFALFSLYQALRQLGLDARLSATELTVSDLTRRQMDTAKLLDIVIDSQDRLEDEVWGQVANDGLLSRVADLEKALGDTEAHAADHLALLDRIEDLEEVSNSLQTAMDLRSDYETAFKDELREFRNRLTTLEGVKKAQTEEWLDVVKRLDGLEDETDRISGPAVKGNTKQADHLRKVLEKTAEESPALFRAQWIEEAGWTLNEVPEEPVYSDLLPSDQPKREERCLAGQCNPSDCEREQCPHRTQEFTVAPFGGVLSEFDGKEWTLTGYPAEWDTVLSQGQVELPCCERAEGEKAVADLVDRINMGEVLYGWEVVDGKLRQKPMDADQSQGLSYGGGRGRSPTTQPPTKGSQ